MTASKAPRVPFLNKSGTIFAGAGSGKTTATVALHHTAHLAGRKAIVITFTNATVHDYIRRANQSCKDIACSNNVFTFHKLAAALLADAALSKNEPSSLETVVALAVEHVTDNGLPPEFQRAGPILVDEGQDCSRENYDLVRVIAEKADTTVVMIGDANQCLYRFRSASERFLLNHAASADPSFTHTLVTNWRSTPQIVAMSRMFMRHPIDAEPRVGAAPGPKPCLSVCDVRTAVADVIRIVHDARERGLTSMLIGRSKRPRFHDGKVVRMGLQMFVNEFEQRSVAFRKMFREASSDEAAASSAIAADPHKLDVLTIHGSKGLEADIVVVIDAVDETLGDNMNPDQLELMYVAFTRARRELHVINSKAAKCDRTLQRCIAAGLCDLQGCAEPSAVGIARRQQERIAVTQLLTDRALVGETQLLDMARGLTMQIKPYARPAAVVEDISVGLPEGEELRTLYGHLAENCLQMAYQTTQRESPRTFIMDRLAAYLDCRVIVPQEHSKALAAFFALTGMRRQDAVSREDVQKLQTRLERTSYECSRVLAFLRFACKTMDAAKQDKAVLVAFSMTQRVRLSELRGVLAAYWSAANDAARLPHLFAACMFFYQLENHAGYRWGRDYTSHVNAFRPHLDRIHHMALDLPPGTAFEKDLRFKHLGIAGRVDVVCSACFIELKFAQTLSLTHYMQPCLYSLLDGEKFSKRAEVWNLATGEKAAVRFDNGPSNRWAMFKMLATLLSRTVPVADITSEDLADGSVRLKSSALRAQCDLSRDAIASAIDFTCATLDTLQSIIGGGAVKDAGSPDDAPHCTNIPDV